MRRPYLKVYIHFVWATWDRLPILTADIRERVFRAILAKCDELGCSVEAIGGVDLGYGRGDGDQGEDKQDVGEQTGHSGSAADHGR